MHRAACCTRNCITRSFYLTWTQMEVYLSATPNYHDSISVCRELGIPLAQLGYKDLLELVKQTRPKRGVMNLWKNIITKGHVEMPSQSQLHWRPDPYEGILTFAVSSVTMLFDVSIVETHYPVYRLSTSHSLTYFVKNCFYVKVGFILSPVLDFLRPQLLSCCFISMWTVTLF